MTERVDVCVVGAGLAGLSAARELLRRGLSVRVLEARDRVGGRVLDLELPDGDAIELGGQFLGPGQPRMARLVDDLDLGTFAVHTTGRDVAIVDGRRFEWRAGGVPAMDPLLLADFGVALARLDGMARTIPLDRPWAAPRAVEWDGETLEAWLRRNVLRRTTRSQLRLLFRSVLAVDPGSVSLLHALFFVASGGGIRRLIGVEDGAQQRRVVGGPQLLAARLAGRLGDVVVTGAPVRRIETTDGGVRVLADGLAVEAGHAIVAIPPTLAGRIDFDPALPGDRDALTQRMPGGSVVKVTAVYDRPFWRDAGLSGHASCSDLTVSATFDNTPPDGSPGALLGFVHGAAARAFARLDAADRRAAVERSLSAYFGPRAARPEAYLEKDWSADPWTRGCYGAQLPPGAWTELGTALRAPIGRIHWAGTETARVWAGYMEGAVESGERAAAEVLEASAPLPARARPRTPRPCCEVVL